MNWQHGAVFENSSASWGSGIPGLKTTDARERLTAELERQEQEDKSHGEKR